MPTIPPPDTPHRADGRSSADTLADTRRGLGFRLVLLARRWRQAIDAELQAAGLTDATWRPLVHLHKVGEGMRQKELAMSLGMDGSSVVRLLDVLAGQGLLERREDPADGRAKTLHLTPEGRRLARHVQELIVAFEEGLLDGLGDGEIAALDHAFGRIERNLPPNRPQRPEAP